MFAKAKRTQVAQATFRDYTSIDPTQFQQDLFGSSCEKYNQYYSFQTKWLIWMSDKTDKFTKPS